jgi:hypothetical protein
LGVDQQCAFNDIKKYLSLPPVMKAPMAGISFHLYIAAEDAVIRVVLMQVTVNKEHIITYLSRCLIDAKTRYFLLKCCVYLCSMLVPNYDITC